MTGSQVRVGLIGVGRWGRNYVRTLLGVSGAELVVVASRNPGTRTLVPQHCSIMTDWRDLVARSDVDAVIIATPPITHAAIATAALDAGKAVLIEKPLTMSVAKAEVICAAAEKTGRPVLVGHTHLFHPAFARLRSEVASRGPVRAIRSSAGNHGPYRRDVPVLWDWGAHDLAMCLSLFEGGTSIEVRSARQLETRAAADSLAECIRLRLVAGGSVSVTITLSTLHDKHRWFAVDLDSGTLIYADHGPTPLTLYAKSGAVPGDDGVALKVSEELPLTLEVMAFVAMVAQGKSTQNSLALGKRVVEVLARCDALLGATVNREYRQPGGSGPVGQPSLT